MEMERSNDITRRMTSMSRGGVEPARTGPAGVRGRAARVVGTLLLVFYLLILFVSSAAGRENGMPHPADPAANGNRGVAWYVEEGQRAIQRENFERAISVLQEGMERYPAEHSLGLMLGDLYEERRLYGAALDVYRTVDREVGEERAVVRRLAETYGRKGLDRDAAREFERLREIAPDDPKVLSDVAWIYYKLSRLEEAEALLLDALDRLGEDKSLLLSLGTVRSELLDYEGAEEAYRGAVDRAKEVDFPAFVAVAKYNLSLVERTFHNYDRALELTDESIEWAERASGFVARGDLHARRRELDEAVVSYRRAEELNPDMPLARLALARLHAEVGQLDEAERFLHAVEQTEPWQWIYDYGTDIQRHRMQVAQLRSRISEARAREVRLRAATGPFDWLRQRLERARLRITAWYHDRVYRSMARGVSDEYFERGAARAGSWTAFRANEPYRSVALRYLEEAREAELPRNPAAQVDYRFEEARLRKDRGELLSLLEELDSPWYRELREQTLRELALLENVGGEAGVYDRLVAELYRMNPGQLRVAGLKIAASVQVTAPGGSAGAEEALDGAREDQEAAAASSGAADAGSVDVRRLERALNAAGVVARSPDDAERTLDLVVSVEGDYVTAVLHPVEEGRRGADALRSVTVEVPDADRSRARAALSANAVVGELFRTRLRGGQVTGQ